MLNGIPNNFTKFSISNDKLLVDKFTKNRTVLEKDCFLCLEKSEGETLYDSTVLLLKIKAFIFGKIVLDIFFA